MSYRGTPSVCDDVPSESGPAAGDRVPDVQGLTRRGLGFPLRLFDVLRGTTHVLLARAAVEDMVDLAAWARELQSREGVPIRVVAVGPEDVPDQPGATILHDPTNALAQAFGTSLGAVLVRPDGYIGWRGRSWRDPGLRAYLDRLGTG